MLRRTRFILNNLRSTPRLKRAGSYFALLAWWSFLLALITGAILSFHYRPWGDVFRDVSQLTGLLPYGSFLRTLHYLSGQCFLIFTLAHMVDCFFKSGYREIPSVYWARLIFILPLAFLLLLTGFILKGDKEGILAARVMYSLAREIPLIGSGIARLFLRPGEDFFLLPYLHHAIIIPFIVLFLLAQHRRRFFPGGALGWPLVAALSLMALIYPLPPDIPPHAETATATGPWFFQGIQLLLRYVPPFWAGVAWPLIPLCLLAALPFVPSPQVRWVKRATAISWSAHGALLILGWWVLSWPGQ